MSFDKLSLEQSKKIFAKAKITYCRYCESPLEGVQISHYSHSHGWNVKGIPEKQWLFIVCPSCNYQWALWKLGVFREEEF